MGPLDEGEAGAGMQEAEAAVARRSALQKVCSGEGWLPHAMVAPRNRAPHLILCDNWVLLTAGNKDIEMTDALAAQDPGADPVQPQDVAAAVEQGQGEQGEQLAGADESAAAAEAGLADNDVGHSGSGLQQQQQTGEEQALAAAEVQGTTEAGALVPPYLLAAAAVQGADAEEEDYDA